MKDNLKVKGRFELLHWNAAGQLQNHIKKDNLVVNTGFAFLAGRLLNDTTLSISHIAVGTDASAALVTDTGLNTQFDPRRSITKTLATSAGGVTNDSVAFQRVLAAGENTATLVEAGLFNHLTAGVMLSRVVFSPIVKEAGDIVTIDWTITFGAGA